MAIAADEETRAFVTGREGFLVFLKEWGRTLPALRLAEVINDAGGLENVAIVCEDLVVGFCGAGPLASPRVAGIVRPIVELFELAHSLGVRRFVLPQDAHSVDSLEFEAWGPHCVEGSAEAETVPELKGLPFSELFEVIPKQNLSPGVVGRFTDWLDSHGSVRRFVVVGDCTDLCVYQAAMYLRLRADQFRLGYEVTVPAECVDTFDISLEEARRLGIFPHDAELLHALFLYHMALNGILIVRALTA